MIVCVNGCGRFVWVDLYVCVGGWVSGGVCAQSSVLLGLLLLGWRAGALEGIDHEARLGVLDPVKQAPEHCVGLYVCVVCLCVSVCVCVCVLSLIHI